MSAFPFSLFLPFTLLYITFIILYVFIYNFCYEFVRLSLQKGTYLEHVSPELTNIHISRDIKIVSEIFGQSLYISDFAYDWSGFRNFLTTIVGGLVIITFQTLVCQLWGRNSSGNENYLSKFRILIAFGVIGCNLYITKSVTIDTMSTLRNRFIEKNCNQLAQTKSCATLLAIQCRLFKADST
jgi:hypothetical protein